MKFISLFAMLAAFVFSIPSFSFAYCDPYSSDFATCTMNETSEALSRPEVDPYDYVEMPEPMQEQYESNEDFMDDYCMMEGYRAAICQ